jgi:hypothetical protein
MKPLLMQLIQKLDLLTMMLIKISLPYEVSKWLFAHLDKTKKENEEKSKTPHSLRIARTVTYHSFENKWSINDGNKFATEQYQKRLKITKQHYNDKS